MMETRLDLIMTKRNETQKYLRNDVADFLRTGLIPLPTKGLDNYMLGRICHHVINYLSAMAEQRECPEECHEAISTLIFSATSFPDLPEMHDLMILYVPKWCLAIGVAPINQASLQS
ncbi:unnamed protein product [Lactuca virosa]|uniref:Uncharacterized protein n=1 Tax=Lactuca virosa TaxID=75947 RepID=A0AAU9MRB0_9ASTR|nr:unnamed protein product [Lactuca virosa]